LGGASHENGKPLGSPWLSSSIGPFAAKSLCRRAERRMLGGHVQKMFVGHVRFAADGAPEFATGWNETQVPKVRISADSRPALLNSRGWFDAYSTSSRVDPFAIESCRCGAKRIVRR